MDKIEHASAIDLLAIRLAKAHRHDLEKRLKKTKTGLTLLPYTVLKLVSFGYETLTDLAREMFVEPPTLVAAVETLAKKGYLQRHRSKNDRRKVALTITAKGREALHKVPHVHNTDRLLKAIAKLGAAKSGKLADLLEELYSKLNK